jgi:phosphorylcholine metabolism protein LicD
MLFSKIKFEIQKILVDPDKFLKNLQQLHDLLEKSPMQGRTWLVGGLVLGYVREGRLLPYDYDADFAFWEEDHERFLKTVPDLTGGGFKKRYCWVSAEGKIACYTFVKEGAKFDFFINYKDEDRNKIFWYAFHAGKGIQLKRELPPHGVKTIFFLGRDWLIPENVEEYLVLSYGSHWRIPDRSFDYSSEKSVPCHVETKKWKGKTRWA